MTGYAFEDIIGRTPRRNGTGEDLSDLLGIPLWSRIPALADNFDWDNSDNPVNALKTACA